MTTLRWGLCYRKSHQSVVRRLSVCNDRVACALIRGLKLSGIFLRHFILWPSFDLCTQLCANHPRETPPSGALNAGGVAKYSDDRPIEGSISHLCHVRAYYFRMSFLFISSLKCRPLQDAPSLCHGADCLQFRVLYKPL